MNKRINNTIRNKDNNPIIRPEFPPKIKPKDLVISPEDGASKPPRSPNAFIIYRKNFVEAAKTGGYHLPMTTVSSMASKSWENESEEVRSYYKKLAKDAYNYRSEMYPKLERRKKRKRWNIVSFQPPTNEISRESPSNAHSPSIAERSPEVNNEQISNQHFISPETGSFLLTPDRHYDLYTSTSFDPRETYPNSELSPISSNSSPDLSNNSTDSFDFANGLNFPFQGTLSPDSGVPNTDGLVNPEIPPINIYEYNQPLELNSQFLWQDPNLIPIYKDNDIYMNNLILLNTYDLMLKNSLGISSYPPEFINDNHDQSIYREMDSL
ncbi:359_t:CDS:1 [Acaulospora morrowiae]|uniref:359_t:CDS:1 n=1 Tax=Acaulospora morrowiae TaxID=94023 RepID=A0A9N8V9R4_9GLOM|nr:359_t:CDS:1 [Acaulospora morrowiae]